MDTINREEKVKNISDLIENEVGTIASYFLVVSFDATPNHVCIVTTIPKTILRKNLFKLIEAIDSGNFNVPDNDNSQTPTQ